MSSHLILSAELVVNILDSINRIAFAYCYCFIIAVKSLNNYLYALSVSIMICYCNCLTNVSFIDVIRGLSKHVIRSIGNDSNELK